MNEHKLKEMLQVARENGNYEDINRLIKVGNMNGIKLESDVIEKSCIRCGRVFRTLESGVNYCQRCKYDTYDRF